MTTIIPELRLETGVFVTKNHADFATAYGTPPPCPEQNAGHTAQLVYAVPPDSIGEVVTPADSLSHTIWADGLRMRRTPDPVIIGIPLWPERTYPIGLTWVCEYTDDNGNTRRMHTRNTTLNVVTHGEWAAHPSSEPLHHWHDHQHDGVAVHGHDSADDPVGLQLAAQASRITALETAIADCPPMP